jgi:hypothetical protein
MKSKAGYVAIFAYTLNEYLCNRLTENLLAKEGIASHNSTRRAV